MLINFNFYSLWTHEHWTHRLAFEIKCVSRTEPGHQVINRTHTTNMFREGKKTNKQTIYCLEFADKTANKWRIETYWNCFDFKSFCSICVQRHLLRTAKIRETIYDTSSLSLLVPCKWIVPSSKQIENVLKTNKCGHLFDVCVELG